MEEYLMHYGIKNQKWGIRRFQNEDGTLTPAGKARLSRKEKKSIKKDWLAYYKKTSPYNEGDFYDGREGKWKEYKDKKMQDSAKQIEQKLKRMYYLMDNYEFDQDDGGGGITKADQRAGKEYWSIVEDIGALSSKIEARGAQLADSYINGKYGKNTMDEIRDSDRRTGMIISGSIIAGLGAMEVGLIVSAIKDIKR